MIEEDKMFGHNKSFEAAPFRYACKVAVNHLSMKVHGEKDGFDFSQTTKYDDRGRVIPSEYTAYSGKVQQDKSTVEANKVGFFDLEPRTMEGKTAVYLRYVIPGKHEPKVGDMPGVEPAFRAYWLGYLMPGQQGTDKAKIPFVDLPKSGPAHNLMLTGSMNGCSLVVTLHPTDPGKLRVYHDSAHGKMTFKDDVVICRIDYADEGYASANKTYPLTQPSPAPLTRTRSASLGSASSLATVTRTRSASFGLAPSTPAPSATPVAPIPCVQTCYGDLKQHKAASTGHDGGSIGLEAKIRTSFNFLYFNTTLSKWVAVSQALETQPSVASPIRAWYEFDSSFQERIKTHSRLGVNVAMAPSCPTWEAVLQY